MNAQERQAWLAEHGCSIAGDKVLNGAGKVICGARTRSGHPCQKPPLSGRNRCKNHGGKSPAGIASSGFKHGKYSKYLPARLVERYEEAAADPYLLEQREQIALLDARLTELLEGIGGDGGRARWRSLSMALGDLDLAARTNDGEGFVVAMNRLRQIVKAENDERETWAEVYAVVEQRRRVVESERTRYVQMGQMVTASQLLSLMGSISALIREHVHDDAALRAISNGIIALAGGAAGGAGASAVGAEPATVNLELAD